MSTTTRSTSPTRGAARPRRRSAACAGIGIGIGVVLAAALVAGCSDAHGAARPPTSQAPLGFRSPPSFLPTGGAPVDQVVTADPSHPQLAAQGVALQVALPSGQVSATVTGPRVPPFVSPPPPDVTATFDISLTHATGTVPVRLADFTVTDQLGRTFHPTLVRNETPPPQDLDAGQSAEFQLTAVMPTGEGRLYWAPTRSTPFAGWDFIVEND